MRRWALALLLTLAAGAASASSPTDVGTSFTSTGAEGELTCDALIIRDRNGLSEPNIWKLRENHTDLTPNPSCAECTGDDGVIRMCLLDTTETSGTRDWRFCEAGTDYLRIPNGGSDQIQNHEVFVGSGAGVGDFHVLTLNTETDGNYVGQLICGAGLSGCPSAGEGTSGTIVAADTSATNEINTITGDNATATSGLAITLAGGAGVQTSVSGNTATVATASQEAGFLANGGASPLTCDTAGKAQVRSTGNLEWCGGEGTPVLHSSGDYQLGPLTGDVTTSGAAATIATGAVTSTKIADGTIADADVSASAAIGRTKIAAGTANQVVINDGSGNLTSEAQLAGSRGGLGVALPTCTSTQRLTANGNPATASCATLNDADLPSTLTRDTEWDTAAEINAATTDDDFVTLTGAQTLTGNKTFTTGHVFLTPASQALASSSGTSSDTILADRDNKELTLTGAPGTVTVTSAPTIANGTNGQTLTLTNVDATTTDCIKLQDRTVLASSNLVLRGTTVTLCPAGGAPPHAITLRFDTTLGAWYEPSPGTVSVYAGTTPKGLTSRLNFAQGDFTATTNPVNSGALDVALDPNITHCGNQVQKSCLTSTVVHTDQTNTWTTGDQVIKNPATLKYTQSDNTLIFDCGFSDTGHCRTGATPSNAADIANKSYVDSHVSMLFDSTISQGTFASFVSRTFCVGGTLQNTTTGGCIQTSPGTGFEMPVVRACSIPSDGVRVATAQAVPANARFDVIFRKNLADTSTVTCSIAAGASACVSSSGSVSFVAGDRWQVTYQCVNLSGTPCNSATTTQAIKAVAYCGN